MLVQTAPQVRPSKQTTSTRAQGWGFAFFPHLGQAQQGCVVRGPLLARAQKSSHKTLPQPLFFYPQVKLTVQLERQVPEDKDIPRALAGACRAAPHICPVTPLAELTTCGTKPWDRATEGGEWLGPGPGLQRSFSSTCCQTSGSSSAHVFRAVSAHVSLPLIHDWSYHHTAWCQKRLSHLDTSCPKVA